MSGLSACIIFHLFSWSFRFFVVALWQSYRYRYRYRTKILIWVFETQYSLVAFVESVDLSATFFSATRAVEASGAAEKDDGHPRADVNCSSRLPPLCFPAVEGRHFWPERLVLCPHTITCPAVPVSMKQSLSALRSVPGNEEHLLKGVL